MEDSIVIGVDIAKNYLQMSNQNRNVPLFSKIEMSPSRYSCEQSESSCYTHYTEQAGAPMAVK